MPVLLNKRSFFIFQALLCFAALLFGYYLQYYQNQMPCPLCILQRLVLIGLILLSGIASLLRLPPWAARFFALCCFLVALIGIVIAGRHVWLQMNPTLLKNTCGPDLSYMIQTLPFSQVLKLLFQGSGDCSKITWRFWGLSLAMWSLLYFCGIALVNLKVGKNK